MRKMMQVEPVLIINLVAAALALLVAFNLPITQEQRDAVLELVGAIVAIFLGGAVVARSRVYSPATVRRMMGEMERDAQA